MSISSAFRNSSSGLASASKWAELTAGNIANANREGYIRRSLIVKSDPEGGILVSGISREVSSNLNQLFRSEIGGVARQEVIASQLDNYSYQLGDPGDSLSIAGQFSNLYSGFGFLSNFPQETALQNNVLTSARGLADSLNGASNALAQTRLSVTSGIQRDVRTMNGGFKKIAALNTQIVKAQPGTARWAGLLDERALEIDAVSKLLNVNIAADSAGNVRITTGNGTLLVDKATSFAVSYDSALGLLKIGNTEITPNKQGVRGFNTGQMAGWFDLKDEILPQMQLQLDEVARVLIQSFEATDASLTTGQAGLFTDLGAAYDPTQLEGLAGRLNVNAAVDPNQGGNIWRIRDGVGASSQGPVADSTQVTAFLNIFETPQSFNPEAGQGDSAGLLDYLSGMIADQKMVRVGAQLKTEELNGRAQTIESARQGVQGVNLDVELQKLTQIEQSYAANAQVTRALTKMLDTLLAAA